MNATAMTGDDLGKARRRPGVRPLRLVAAALAAVIAATPLAAEPAPADAPTYPFEIPSQPIETALHAYSATTGVEVLYESGLADGIRSAPVSGRLSAHDALLALLGRADIVVRYTGSKAITLARRPDEAATAAGAPELALDPLDVLGGAAAADPSALRLYGQAVQADVEGRLRRDARTRAGAYRAEIALWIDPSRTVRRATLARSTGDAARDAAIVEALNGLVVARQAPPEAAQPIRLLVTVKAR